MAEAETAELSISGYLGKSGRYDCNNVPGISPALHLQKERERDRERQVDLVSQEDTAHGELAPLAFLCLGNTSHQPLILSKEPAAISSIPQAPVLHYIQLKLIPALGRKL